MREYEGELIQEFPQPTAPIAASENMPEPVTSCIREFSAPKAKIRRRKSGGSALKLVASVAAIASAGIGLSGMLFPAAGDTSLSLYENYPSAIAETGDEFAEFVQVGEDSYICYITAGDVIGEVEYGTPENAEAGHATVCFFVDGKLSDARLNAIHKLDDGKSLSFEAVIPEAGDKVVYAVFAYVKQDNRRIILRKENTSIESER